MMARVFSIRDHDTEYLYGKKKNKQKIRYCVVTLKIKKTNHKHQPCLIAKLYYSVLKFLEKIYRI